MDYAKRKTNNIVSSIINKSINDVIYKNSYENIIQIDKDNNGNITNLNFDSKKINELLYLTTNDILNSIDDLEHINSKDKVYYVPMGVIHNIPILVNIGPKIPFKIDIIANTDNSIYTHIKDYGINNSIIEVILKIKLNIQIILPFTSKNVEVIKEIPIDTKIIEGKVPTYYGGISTNN